MLLPDSFCWSKFGTEAGEEAGSILARKEREIQEWRCLPMGYWYQHLAIADRLTIRYQVSDDPVHPNALSTSKY